MNVLVIYDSQYGNTAKIAEAIAGAAGTKAVKAGNASPEILKGVDILIVGSPTQGWRPTKAVQEFVKKLSLSNVSVAAFDTRFKKPRLLTGSAAKNIANTLKSAGGTLVAEPESFFVSGTEGPLLGGEIERAHAWAHAVIGKRKVPPL